VSLTCLAIAAYVLAATPAAPPPSHAGAANDARPKVEVYLAGHDVPTAAELRSLASAPEKPLMAIATDVRAEGLLRARAVAALRLVPSPEVQAFLGKLVQAKAKASDATDRLIVRRAAVALGWMAGPDAPEKLALLFENDDAEVRLDTAIALGLTRGVAAPTLLRRQLAVESVARVRDQIERQLRALGQSPTEAEKPERPKEKPPMRSGF
jgi:HEAT repeat protein